MLEPLCHTFYSIVNDLLLQRCSIVLVRPKFPGNLGSVARAMANFGINDLRLVAPEADPRSTAARALATHGEGILEQATQHATLQAAVANMHWVAATSARTGGLFRSQNVLPLKEGITLAKQQAAQGRLAFVFGPEDHGLTNEEISLCHYLLTIPANPAYDILNLAQAAMLVMYEWYQATAEVQAPSGAALLASMGEMETMLAHLEKALREVHYIWGEKGPSVFHALRHFLLRAQPTQVENKLLHGLARQLLWYVQQHDPKSEQPPGEREAASDASR